MRLRTDLLWPANEFYRPIRNKVFHALVRPAEHVFETCVRQRSARWSFLASAFSLMMMSNREDDHARLEKVESPMKFHLRSCHLPRFLLRLRILPNSASSSTQPVRLGVMKQWWIFAFAVLVKEESDCEILMLSEVAGVTAAVAGYFCRNLQSRQCAPIQ